MSDRERRPSAAPIRVGFVIGQLSVGGAEGQLYELVRHLSPRFSPIVYCLAAQAGTLSQDLARVRIPVFTVGSRGPRRAWRLRSLLREHGVDLVHSWLFIANGYAAAATALGRTQPLITSARNCKVQGKGSQLINQIAFRASDAIVVNSRDVEAYIVRHYAAPSERIRVIVNGVDTKRFHPAVSGGATNSPCIVTIGRMVQQKNQALFLDAAKRVLEAFADVRFMLVGDGPLRASLEKRAADLGIAARVTFTGERRDTEEILRGASLFWLTSRWEGMPNTVLEALASGVPAIATDVGGTREILREGMDGFVVASGDAGGFVQHSLDLLRDSALRDSFAGNARRRAEEYSPERMAETFEALYDAILSRRLSPRDRGLE